MTDESTQRVAQGYTDASFEIVMRMIGINREGNKKNVEMSFVNILRRCSGRNYRV